MNINKNAIIAGASVVSFAAGSVAGYFFAKKRLEARIGKLAEEEIEGVKQMYRARFKEGEYSTPESSLKTFKEVANKLGYTEESPLVTAPEVTHVDMPELLKSLRRTDPLEKVQYNQAFDKNIWQDVAQADAAAKAAVEAEPPSELDWTWDKELDWRDHLIRQNKPYVISNHEFFNNEGNDEVQLTFYAGDNALINTENEMIEDIDDSINQDNLIRFGAWSNDPTVVYVRNEFRGVDYEITYNELNYVTDILGLPSEPVQT